MRILVKILVAALLCSVGAANGARDAHMPNDALEWLGPLPRKLNEEMVERQLTVLQEKIKHDLQARDVDIRHFVCKRPDQVGPIPQMEAVRAYLAAWPNGSDDADLVSGVYRAAAAGNWLARAQLYLMFEPDTLAERYRSVQLGLWMQHHKLGPLYAQFGEALEGSGYYSDVPGTDVTGVDMYAALHNSYPAQNKVGKALSEHAETAAIGRAMLACASSALPEYERIFSGDAEQAAEQRRESAHDVRLPPLHRAVMRGDTERVSTLLAAGSDDIDAPNIDDQTALDLALLAELPSPQIVGMLIAHGAHADESHKVDRYKGGTHLTLAVAAPASANLALVKLLMESGADPFATTPAHQYIFQTPFALAADAYGNGKDDTVFDYMLASRRLAPRSALATEYVDAYANTPLTFARLLAYGAVPSGKVFEHFFSADKDDAAGLERLSGLLQRYPQLRAAVRNDDGRAALRRAVYDCRFDLAVGLAELGAPFANDLVRAAVERCDEQGKRYRAVSEPSRRKFFALLAARNYDLDANEGECVSWIPNCRLRDEAVVRELLAVGADPYRYGRSQYKTPVLVAIEDCKPALAELMLASPPKRREPDTQVGLDQAARRAANPNFCPKGTDMAAVLERLVSYGAARPQRPEQPKKN